MLCGIFAALLGGCNAGHPSSQQLAHVDRLVHERVAANFNTQTLFETRKSGQPPAGELTLSEARDLALARNLSLVAGAENLSIAHAQLVQAGLIANPTIGQSSGFLFPLTSGAGPASLDFNIVQQLNSIFTQPARVSVARLQEVQANIDLASSAFGLAQQVDGKYQELIHLRRNLKLQMRVTALYERAVQAAEARQRVGIVTMPELNRARLAYEDARRQVRHYNSQYARAASELNWMMGFVTPPQWKLPDAAVDDVATVVQLPGSENVEKLAVNFRLDLLRAEFDQRISERNVELARIGLVPTMTVGGEFAGDYHGHWSGGPLFSITLPIFDPGLVSLELARAQKRLADKTYESLAGQVRQDVRTALSNWLIAAEDVTFFRDRIIPQQEENVKLMEISFRLGNDDLDALLNVYQSYVQQLGAFEDAVQAYHDAGVALQQAVGMTWPRVLEELKLPSTRPAATAAATPAVNAGGNPTTGASAPPAASLPATPATAAAPDAATAELNRLFQQFAPDGTTQPARDPAAAEWNRIFPPATLPATRPSTQGVQP